MKTAILVSLVACSLSGCVALGPLQGGSSGNAAGDDLSPTAAAAPDPLPSPAINAGPGLIIPATGGPPVIGIPVGGGLYAPVTGGAPVTGIPIGP